ncbi:Ankyrin repeat domain-containing protein 13C, partial [Bienertia sinuspersici]
MHNVVVSVKSGKVPGATTDDELFFSCNDNVTIGGVDVLIGHRNSCYESREITIEDANGCKNAESKNEKKGWFDGWRKRDQKSEGQKKLAPPRSSVSVDERKSDASNISPSRIPIKPRRHSVDVVRGDEPQRGRDKKTSASGNLRVEAVTRKGVQENEYKKALRPILWLSPNFPLRREELLPLPDILANKVKAILCLRELLTTKHPLGTFPVK